MKIRFVLQTGLKIYMTIVVTTDLQDLADKITVVSLAASLAVVKAIRKSQTFQLNG